MLKMFGWVVLGFAGLFALSWIAMGNSFFMYKFFAPKQEQVRREVFEQTKSYRQGMIQELENMRFEYIKAAPEHRAALASIIIHRAADFPAKDMPYDLAIFINEIREGKK